MEKYFTSGHKLQSEHHPASYYDKSSSHYKGGAHNMLIELAKSGQIEDPRPKHGHQILVQTAKELYNGNRPA